MICESCNNREATCSADFYDDQPNFALCGNCGAAAEGFYAKVTPFDLSGGVA